MFYILMEMDKLRLWCPTGPRLVPLVSLVVSLMVGMFFSLRIDGQMKVGTFKKLTADP